MTSGMLIASPQMADPFFAETVVLLCEYNEDGALGIVINRTHGMAAEEVLAQMEVEPSGGISGPVLWGGPVQAGAVFLTFCGEAPASTAGDEDEPPIFDLLDSVHVSPSRSVIEAVARLGKPGDAFLSLGYAGWGPGQLDDEIQIGSWLFFEVDQQTVFRVPPEGRYEHCLAQLGVDSKMLMMSNPIDE